MFILLFSTTEFLCNTLIHLLVCLGGGVEITCIELRERYPHDPIILLLHYGRWVYMRII